MGWETRGRGGRYYTRSRRVNGRIVREYVGSGLVGELAAAEHAEARARRHADLENLRRLAERGRALNEQLKALDEAVTAAASGVLLMAGYRRHHRGEWRRTRGKQD